MRNRPLALLVEDSPTQAVEFAAAIKTQGFDVMIAEDGLMGLEMAYSHVPDLIVLDINLPEMNGFQVCHRLKRNPLTASAPVIMLTVADSSAATLAGLEAGAVDYIPKDVFAADNLIRVLKAIHADLYRQNAER